jgi:hypothetical protein
MTDRVLHAAEASVATYGPRSVPNHQHRTGDPDTLRVRDDKE